MEQLLKILEDNARLSVEDIATMLNKSPAEVAAMIVLLMSGGYDLQLVIKGQTFQEIALFVAKRLSPLDDVLSTATHFVLRTYKKEGRLYQDDEIDERECTVL